MGHQSETHILVADRDELCKLMRACTGLAVIGDVEDRNPGYLTTGELRVIAQHLLRLKKGTGP